MDDSKLIDLLEKEPRKAVAKILEKYGSVLLGVIQKIVDTKEVAEDTLQETCVKIWKNASSYNPDKGRLFTWLINIARNTALDKVRTHKYQTQKQSKQVDEGIYNDIGLSEEMNIPDIGLRRVMERLDEKYRKIIELLYLQGYTQKEVSHTLDIPLGTVKTRARHGLRQLRELLKKEGK